MRPHFLEWFHKKAPKLRQQGALQISRRRDDVRLMMNARSRWWWCWYSTPKMKRNREEEGKHVWASQLQRPPLVNFSSTDNGLHIILHTYIYQRTESYRGFLLRSTTLSKGRCGKQLTVNTRLYHTHDITFFHITKGKRRKSSYSILTGKTFGDIDSYLLLLVFLWKCGILTEKLCELRACPISHFAYGS